MDACDASHALVMSNKGEYSLLFFNCIYFEQHRALGRSRRGVWVPFAVFFVLSPFSESFGLQVVLRAAVCFVKRDDLTKTHSNVIGGGGHTEGNGTPDSVHARGRSLKERRHAKSMVRRGFVAF